MAISTHKSTQWASAQSPTSLRALVLRTSVGNLGWLPILALNAALGLTIVAGAYSASRLELAWAQPWFWIGYLVMLVPLVARIAVGTNSRNEMIGVLIVFGMSIYWVKLLYSPAWFAMGDEVQHWRTTYDVIWSAQLFTPNPILPVSPYYPGLENATLAAIALMGLPIFEAGLVLVGVARLLLIIGFFLFFETVLRATLRGPETRSIIHMAGMATLIYMLSPQFVVFDAQFAYGSLALGISAVILYVLANLTVADKLLFVDQTVIRLMIVVGLFCAVVVHHVSSLMLVAFLGIWAVVTYMRQRWGTDRGIVGWAASIGAILALVWLAFVAVLTIPYLGQPIIRSVENMTQLLAGTAPPRQFFAAVRGTPVPLWIRISGLASGGLILLVLPIGWWFTFKRFHNSSIGMALMLFSFIHPVIQIIRLTPEGLTTGGRMLSYVFWGVGFVLAIGFVSVFRMERWRRLAQVAFGAWASVIIFGTMASIVSVWQLPGQFVAGSYTRSIQPQNRDVALWTRKHIGTARPVGGDVANGYMLAAYGHQNTIGPGQGIWVSEIVYGAGFIGAHQHEYLRNAGIAYVALDRRADVAAVDSIDQSNPDYFRTSLDRTAGFSRIFSDGAISIYSLDPNVLAADVANTLTAIAAPTPPEQR
jgi:hypothetical protein